MSIRDNDHTPPYHLIPPTAIRRIARVFKEGATRYGDYTWTEKGLPFTETMDHAIEHLMKYIEGDRSEDHIAKVAWGMVALMWLEEHRPECDDTIWSAYAHPSYPPTPTADTGGPGEAYPILLPVQP